MLIAATNGLRVKFSVKGSAPNAGWHIGKAVLHEESPQTPADYLPDWNTPLTWREICGDLEENLIVEIFLYIQCIQMIAFTVQKTLKLQIEFQNTEIVTMLGALK